MSDKTEKMVTLADVAQDRPDGAQSDDVLTVTDNPDQGSYEARVGDETVAGVVYTRNGDHVTLLATSVYPQHRGKGLAGRLLDAVLEDLRQKHETVSVSCPFATTYVETHPEYRRMIAPGGPA